MYLLDTNICIALSNQNPQALAQFYAKFNNSYIPTIVLAELYKGAYCSQKIEQNLQRLNEFSSRIIVVPFDKNASEEFGKIQAELRRIGRPTGEIDALIAAVARSRQDILVTNNIKHFENIPNLQLENWL
ncbi:twitching motility protein PilT [Scytonema hofmannii PCC 7110]|uniref:Twitching motility protein PilT n=1 Tax=Scytonema hofmannii PCC 7110 TaxID=128403 RepID=A0A139WY46_9CYAN|nr:type II toxin-antitoxin system VapC family toxin [Scytonema hofmannii]KYC37323.1 twitching motility protein PilT [Scytonema hofmannii PCC 7110]